MTKPLCGAQRANQPPGVTCKKPAGWGTDHPGYGHCKRHAGSTETGRKSAQRQQAEHAVLLYGLPREIDPHTALLEELWRTAGHVAWLRDRVAQLEDQDRLHGPVGGGGESYPREEPHIWVRMYQDERKHLATVARDCIRAGIEERRVKIAEELGQMIARFGRRLLDHFGIDPMSEEARRAFRKYLAELGDGSTPDS